MTASMPAPVLAPPDAPPATVQELWRYPVKSMAGERVDWLEFTRQGVVGDRVWTAVDAASRQVLTAKREPRLLEISARWEEGVVALTVPGKGTVRVGDRATPAALSSYLGRAVRLGGPSPDGRLVECPEEPDEAADGGPWPADIPVTTFAKPRGSLVDESPVHLLSDRSLAQAARLHPHGLWDVRRFRPNVFVTAGGSPTGSAGSWPDEDTWIGADVTAGDVVLRVSGACGRCVMVTMPQPRLPRDRDLLRALHRDRGGTLGVYADVLVPGSIRVGDEVAARSSPSRPVPFALVMGGEQR